MTDSKRAELSSRRRPAFFWCFSLVVVRLGRRFLLIKERKHEQSWYIPAGRLEPHESFQDAAIREVFEESGIRVVLEGVIRVEVSPPRTGDHYRQRVIFLARPADDQEPAYHGTEDSLSAGWFTLEETERMDLRGHEVLEIFRYIERGEGVYPLKLLSFEGAPW